MYNAFVLCVWYALMCVIYNIEEVQLCQTRTSSRQGWETRHASKTQKRCYLRIKTQVCIVTVRIIPCVY